MHTSYAKKVFTHCNLNQNEQRTKIKIISTQNWSPTDFKPQHIEIIQNIIKMKHAKFMLAKNMIAGRSDDSNRINRILVWAKSKIYTSFQVVPIQHLENHRFVDVPFFFNATTERKYYFTVP